ncbi:MAG: EthD family reductase [Pseudolabrys sp.]
MVKVSVFYPNSAGCRFDMNYYLTKHMPMVQQKLGAACKSIAVEQGIAGGAPGAPATYVAMGHLYFDSTDAFASAFGPHAQEILADIPNYTNTQPTIQISDVKA